MSELLLRHRYRFRPVRDWRFSDLGYVPQDFTFTRADAATCATYRDSTGTRQTAAANVARFDHTAAGVPLGLLLEPSRTNYLLNSLTPATQTTGSLGTGTYVLWVEGSGSAAVAGDTATITGAGTATEGTPVVFTVTVAGTVTVTVSGTLTAFQLENGGAAQNVATSLIVTAGATATRAADVCSLSTLTPWFNASEGTFLLDWVPISAAANALSLDDGTASNRFRIQIATTSLFAGVDVGGAAQAAFTGSSVTLGSSRLRALLAYSVNDFEFVANAAQVGTDTSGSLPTVTKLNVGANATGGNHAGWFRRVAYWNLRLPSARLLYESDN